MNVSAAGIAELPGPMDPCPDRQTARWRYFGRRQLAERRAIVAGKGWAHDEIGPVGGLVERRFGTGCEDSGKRL